MIPNYYRPGDPLDKLVPFLCPTCGGINDARQYTLLRVAYSPGLIMPCKKCECAPDPIMKRDGWCSRCGGINHEGHDKIAHCPDCGGIKMGDRYAQPDITYRWCSCEREKQGESE